ncbi:hypothetical protein D3C85_1546960 [compost metagenome]
MFRAERLGRDRRAPGGVVADGDRGLDVDARKDLEVLRFESEAQGKGIARAVGLQLIGIFGHAQSPVERQLTDQRCTIPQRRAAVDIDHRHLGMPRPANGIGRV